MTLHVVQGPLKIHSASTLRSQQVQSTPSQPLSSHWFVKVRILAQQVLAVKNVSTQEDQHSNN